MKKYIIALVVTMILAYIGYEIYKNITTLKYAFASVYGAFMMMLNIKMME